MRPSPSYNGATPYATAPGRQSPSPASAVNLGLCLLPCTAEPETRATHDPLVADLVRWLAGQKTAGELDPCLRAEEVAGALTRKGLHEEARLAEPGPRAPCHRAAVVRRACRRERAALCVSLAAD